MDVVDNLRPRKDFVEENIDIDFGNDGSCFVNDHGLTTR